MKTCAYCKRENPDSATACRECGMEIDPSPAKAPDLIPALEKIATLNHEVEAERLDSELTALAIPHVMITYSDSAFDGLFQMSHGWGHVEAPQQHRDTILEIVEQIRQERSDSTPSVPEDPA
ncbi:MAG: hypothetical protein NTW03_09240 [Verrucomicrobia bacterium]|nr:hypothetical protein [Verrucomicrobiota bacterium]